MKVLLRTALPCLFWIQLGFPVFAQSGIITTYAGPGLSANGTQADTQAIGDPSAVTPDGTGGFYLASRTHHKVYRVTAGGTLSIFAGNGFDGYGGDGGLAISAQLSYPSGLVVDAAGNLFIADYNTHQIRKVTPDGIISTVAGNGIAGFGGDGGLAISAQLNNPLGMAVDAAGNLFIADYYNHRVRKVTLDGTISTVAGNGYTRSCGFLGSARCGSYSGDHGPATSASLNYPLDVAVDASGNLFIADSHNDRIRKVTPDGIINTIAGNGTPGFSGDGGPAASARLYNPNSLALDASGNLFISDEGNLRIRKMARDGIISTFAGNGTHGFSGDGGPAASAELSYQYCIAMDAAGNLFIADQGNLRIRKVTSDGIINTVAGNGVRFSVGDGGPAISAQLNYPSSVAMDAVGNLFIADTGNQRIRKITPDRIISTIAGTGINYLGSDGGQAISTQLYNPSGIAVDAAGNLFIADAGSHRIRKVSSAGIINTVAGNGTPGFKGDGSRATSAYLNYPSGVAVDTAGNLFIADCYSHRIRKVSPDGVINTVAGNGTPGFSGDRGPAISASLQYPYGIAVDAVGNLFIADSHNARIRKVTPDGIINTVAGNGIPGYNGDGIPSTSAQLHEPHGVALDTVGNLYIADTYDHRIRMVTPLGIIKTIAGNGSDGSGGDNGFASSAQLSYPRGVAVDVTGNLYIADTQNNRIRKVAGTTVIDTYFPHIAIGGGWSTSFALSNIGSTTIHGNLILTDFQGNPFIVRSSNLGVGSSFPISIPSGGSIFLAVNPLNSDDPQKSGWAKVEAWGGSLNGVAKYNFVSQGAIQNAAGVLSSQATQFATIPVDDNSGQGRNTAYGIANPTDQILTIKLALVDSNGIVVDDTVSITLNPGQQIARYFNQDFLNQEFQGSIVLRAQGGGFFVAVALVQKQKLFTAIPVIRSKASNIPN